MDYLRARQASRAAVRRSRPSSSYSSANDANTPATMRPEGFARIDTFPDRRQHDPTLTQVTDGHHHLGGVPAQTVDPDNDDGVALSRVFRQCREAGALLATERRGLMGVARTWRRYCGEMVAVRQFQVTFDCAAPERVARFWCEVLGYVSTPST